jgi:hypothetical protein
VGAGVDARGDGACWHRSQRAKGGQEIPHQSHPPTPLPPQRDLAPLPKLVRAEQRRDAQRADLEAREALERDRLRAAVASGALGAEAPGHVAGLGGDSGAGDAGGPLAGLAAGDARPMEVPEVLSGAERRHWERTDDIIMGVLRR